MRAVLSECLSPLPHSVPILASLDPNCERFSFRVFWIRCAVTVNFTLLALNLRWVARVILFHLRFLFIRLPSTWRCGLAETVGLCFRVDSDCVTLGFVLGLVCVCLFCSVVVVSFVVGWQQHCRYIVTDAMVYPKNWILEDEFSTGKTSGVFGLNMVFLHLISRQRRFSIWELRHCAWIDRDEFWMMLHHLFCGFGRRFVCLWLSFDHECDLEPWTFFYGSCPYMVVMWLDEMSCRKGVWKFDTLW